MDYKKFISLENQNALRTEFSKYMRANVKTSAKYARLMNMAPNTLKVFLMGNTIEFETLCKVEDYMIKVKKEEKKKK